MRVAPQARILSDLFNVNLSELIKHKSTVYEWRGIYFEIVVSKSKTAPASHYTSFRYSGKNWSIRELGNKSKIVKEINEKI